MPYFQSVNDISMFLPQGWQDGYRVPGWHNDNKHFKQIDVLLHPAKAKSGSMVISGAIR